MYQIITIEGTTIGSTESPNYIKVGKSGCYVNATKEDAVGVAYNSTPYNLIGHNEISDAETVVITEYNGAEKIFEQETAITEIEDAVCENDVSISERLAAIEDALCEFDLSIQ